MCKVCYKTTSSEQNRVQHTLSQDMSKSLCQYVCISSIFCVSEGNLVSLYSTYKLESIVSRVSRQPRNHGSIPIGCRRCLFSKVLRSPLGPRQPPNEWVPGALSPGVKCPECESDHSPLRSTEVKKFWSCTATPPHAFTFHLRSLSG